MPLPCSHVSLVRYGARQRCERSIKVERLGLRALAEPPQIPLSRKALSRPSGDDHSRGLARSNAKWRLLSSFRIEFQAEAAG